MKALSLAVLLSFGLLNAGAAVKIHRSFRPVPLNGGGGTQYVVPGYNLDRGRKPGFVKTPEETPQPLKKMVGKVISVVDGDTIGLRPGGGQLYQIDLDRIDAPESDQPHGETSKRFLSDLLLNKSVEIQYRGKSTHNKVTGIVYVKTPKGMVDANLTMVRNGMAWHLPDDQTPAYVTGAESARKEKRGLWADANPIDPADWREGKGRPQK